MKGERLEGTSARGQVSIMNMLNGKREWKCLQVTRIMCKNNKNKALNQVCQNKMALFLLS